ncbi:MAG TPA: hypothetical protein VF657_13365 [Actinoplanes sp.]|jgi:hypothetical protein
MIDMPLALDDILDEASLPEQTVLLCLNGKLRAQYDQMKARIDARAEEAEQARLAATAARTVADDRLGAKTPAALVAVPDPEQPALDALVVKMRRYTIGCVLRAIPSQDWNRLVEKHPPRKLADNGRFDPRDGDGVNSRTFYPELVRLSLAEPAMTDAQYEKLMGKVTDAMFDRLAQAAADVNRRDEDIPFSLGGSESPRS